MKSFRERNEGAIQQIVRELSPVFKENGFKKSGKYTWRLRRPQIVSSYKLYVGPKEIGSVQGEVGLTVPSAPTSSELIFAVQTQLSGRSGGYDTENSENVDDFVHDAVHYAIPWLQSFSSFEHAWLDLLEARMDNYMGGDGPGNAALEALKVAHYGALGERFAERALLYIEANSFCYEQRFLDDELVEAFGDALCIVD